jgi:hypothetical protein
MESFFQPDRSSRSPSEQIVEEAKDRLRKYPHVNRRNVSCECEDCVL